MLWAGEKRCRKMKLRNIILILVFLGLAALIIFRFATFSKGEKPLSIEEVQRKDGIPVDVFVAKMDHFTRWKKLVGSVEGIKQAPIYSNMTARVRNVMVKQGQRVGRGQAIIVLDPLSVSQSYQALEGARLQYENLKREYERIKPLYEAGAVSESQFDQLKLGLEAAKAALKDIRSSITLRSPISGIVTDLRVRMGEKTEPGLTLAVIADLRKANLKLEVSQRDLEELKEGQEIIVTNGDQSQQASGTIKRISLSADPETRLFLVEATIDGNGHIRPGTLQNVRIKTTDLEQALVIPRDAVITSTGQMFVFVVANDKCEKREIKVANYNDTMIVVEEGLSLGEQVVIWGMNLLNGGETVQIHKVVETL